MNNGIRTIVGLVVGLSLSATLMAGHVFTIPHGIGVYVSPTGRDYFQNSGDDLAKRYKVNLNHQNLGNKLVDLGEKTPDEMMPDNPHLTTLIKQAKASFAKFFKSREIKLQNKHHIIIDVKNIDVSARWNHVGIDFIKHTHSPSTPTKLYLNLVLNNFHVTVDKVSVQDTMHSFLETIGIDNIVFGSATGSVPLTFKVPVDLLVKSGKFNFTVYPLETNLNEIRLGLAYTKPLRVPVVEIVVNGRIARTRLDQIEKLLSEKQDDLMAGLTKSVGAYLDKDFAPTIQKTLNEKSNLKFAEFQSMEPLGAPNHSVAPFQYKLIPAGLDYKDDHLHFFLDAFIQDTKYSTIPGLDDRLTAVMGVQSRTLNKYPFDVAVSLNEGFINQLLQLSERRGYYNYTVTADGTRYRNVKRPQFAIGGRTGEYNGLPPVVKMKLQYNVTGVQQYAVNNPIEIDFDLKLKFPIKNGKAQIVVAGVDSSSVHVAARFARFEILWPKILEAAKETLMEMDLAGMVLCEEIPIPTDLFGFPMRITHAEPDANGHILVFMDYDL